MSEDRRPAPDEYDAYYGDYVETVEDGPVLARLVAQGERLRALLAGLGPRGADYRYAPDKWSIKQVLGHLADAERVFGMRAACIARGETAPLPGFEQDDYVRQGGFEARSTDSLLRELELLRGANVEMFAALPPEAWDRRGTASGVPVSVRAVAWILAGHLEHHLAVLRDRYGEAFAR
jgi:transposase